MRLVYYYPLNVLILPMRRLINWIIFYISCWKNDVYISVHISECFFIFLLLMMCSMLTHSTNENESKCSILPELILIVILNQIFVCNIAIIQLPLASSIVSVPLISSVFDGGVILMCLSLVLLSLSYICCRCKSWSTIVSKCTLKVWLADISCRHE